MKKSKYYVSIWNFTWIRVPFWVYLKAYNHTRFSTKEIGEGVDYFRSRVKRK